MHLRPGDTQFVLVPISSLLLSNCLSGVHFFNTLVKSKQALLQLHFARLNNPSYLSFLSAERFSIPLIILAAFSYTSSNWNCITETGARAACSNLNDMQHCHRYDLSSLLSLLGILLQGRQTIAFFQQLTSQW